MYTFTAAQHHFSHPCFLHPPPHLYPSHALKFSCPQSHRSTFFLSHVLQSLCGLRASGNGRPHLLSPVRGLGSDGGDEEDDVYMRRFTADSGRRGFSADRGDRELSGRNDRETRSSGGRGERPVFAAKDRERSSRERGDRTSNSYGKVGPGFRPGFKGAEGRSSFRGDSRGTSRGSFAGNVDGKAGGVSDGGDFQPRDGKGFRGGERTGAGTERHERVLNPRGRGPEERSSNGTGDRQRTGGEEGRAGRANGKEFTEVDGEYRRPGWKEDPKAERKRKKEPAIAPQVQFSNPMNKQPHVAILGGGMSGLVCALTLEELGIRSTVFDTGKHGLGGRMATRHIEIRDDLSLAFDHAAQYFTVSDPEFGKLVNQWIERGAVKEWKGSVGTLQAGGRFTELPDVPRYVGTHGMRALADHMVSQSRMIEVKRPVWISNMDARGDQWKLNENGKPHGEYDIVVIAHNDGSYLAVYYLETSRLLQACTRTMGTCKGTRGKCANRLLAPSGAPLVFKQMKRLELSSIWALMAAFNEALPMPEGLHRQQLDGAFVEGVNAVSWMANNSQKLTLADKNAPHCWTFFSTGAFGKKNKVPQESIPVVKAEKVRREMLRGAEIALGLSEGSMPAPFFTKIQLWGAGLPTNTPGVPCIFDPIARVGVCGDWLLGSSLEAAALSGMALAHHIVEYRNRGDLNPEEFSIGLHKSFSEVEGKDIGQFPGTPTPEAKSITELVASNL